MKARSILLPDDGPTLHLREAGTGFPLVLLHGGWGYGIYPFERQVDALAGDFRCLAPDRTGYGRSPALEELPPDFHGQAADETLRLLDALGLEHAALWGHSDGAVIAARLALRAPERFPAVVLESLHLWKDKPASRGFFETAATAPERFGERAATALRADHGDRWRHVVQMNGRAWLRLADEAKAPTDDLYGGRLADADRTRVLVLHGADDPRTEPGELDAILAQVPGAEAAILADGRHSPHSERAVAAEATRRAATFLRQAVKDAHP